MNNIFATIEALDLTNVTGGAGAQSTPTTKQTESAAKRQKAFAKKIMSQPFPSESIPGLDLM